MFYRKKKRDISDSSDPEDQSRANMLDELFGDLENADGSLDEVEKARRDMENMLAYLESPPKPAVQEEKGNDNPPPDQVGDLENDIQTETECEAPSGQHSPNVPHDNPVAAACLPDKEATKAESDIVSDGRGSVAAIPQSTATTPQSRPQTQDAIGQGPKSDPEIPRVSIAHILGNQYAAQSLEQEYLEEITSQIVAEDITRIKRQLNGSCPE